LTGSQDIICCASICDFCFYRFTHFLAIPSNTSCLFELRGYTRVPELAKHLSLEVKTEIVQEIDRANEYAGDMAYLRDYIVPAFVIVSEVILFLDSLELRLSHSDLSVVEAGLLKHLHNQSNVERTEALTYLMQYGYMSSKVDIENSLLILQDSLGRPFLKSQIKDWHKKLSQEPSKGSPILRDVLHDWIEFFDNEF
jgi:hypothetical protein